MTIQVDNIPSELKNLPNWVVHRKKVPYTPGTGEPAKSNDPTTWRTFDEAAADQSADGIGFMFSNSGYVGVDIDRCIDEAGNYNEQARAAIDTLQSYTEISTSGTGIHIICKGNVPGDRNRNTKLGMEIYDSGRYFVMTGHVVELYKAIRDCQDDINRLYAAYYAPPKPKSTPMERLLPPSSNDDVMAIIERVKGQTGEKVRALLRGDMTGYKSHSEADQALCNYLAFYCGKNAAEMDRIFRCSGLMRPKWDEKHGPKTYGAMTIDKAIKGTVNVYAPKEYKRQKIVESLPHRGRFCAEMNNEEGLRKLFFLPCTDAGNAERLAELIGNEWLYNTDIKRWLHWTGKQWKKCIGNELNRLATDSMRLIATAFLPSASNDKNITLIQKWLVSSENQSRTTAMLKKLSDNQAVTSDMFDKEDYILNVQNGVVDLKTGLLSEHKAKDYLTQICNAKYEKAPTSHLWENTIKQILPDEKIRDYVQKLFGYVLTGSTEEEIFIIFYGEGGHGKGTILETIAYAMGDYATTIDVNVLLMSRTAENSGGNAATPEIAKLQGKRLVVTSETNRGKHFDEAKIKWLTGGDVLTARPLHCDPVTFSPNFKLILTSNYLPNITDSTDTGIKRRLIIVPFTADISSMRNNKLKKELKEPQHLGGCLDWCVEGCLLWQREGLGKPPAEMQQAVDTYYAANDIFQQWLDECTESVDGNGVQFQRALESYNDFVSAGNNHRGVSRIVFRQMIDRHGLKTGMSKGCARIKGVALKTGSLV